MRKTLLWGTALVLCTATLPSCKKKESGVCYCKYFGGNKSEYDLNSLSRSRQVDSCYELDRLAEPFAGDCDLK